MKELTPPKCPSCNKKMSSSGGVIGQKTIINHWTCWVCKETVDDKLS